MDCLIPLDSLLCVLFRVVQLCVELYIPRNANNESFGGLSTTYSDETRGNNRRSSQPPLREGISTKCPVCPSKIAAANKEERIGVTVEDCHF